MRIRSIVRALTILLVGATSLAAISGPAAAGNPTGLPSGAGWGAGYYFNGPGSISYWVDLPGDVIDGTITFNAQNNATLTLNVTQGKAGPCVHGNINDFDSGISIDVLNGSTCQVSTVWDSATELAPMGEYDISICAGTTGKLCNSLTIYNLPFWTQLPAGSYSEWAYSDATHLAFSMAVGAGTFTGSATRSFNGFTAVSTLKETNSAASACVSVEDVYSASGTSRCGPGSMPLNFSTPIIGLNFAYSISGTTDREISFIPNPTTG